MAENPTFSQRHDYEPLPEPMQTESLSEDLRREIWNTVRSDVLLKITTDSGFYREKSRRFIERVLGEFFKIPEDQINSSSPNQVFRIFKQCITGEIFHKVLTLLEIIMHDEYLGIITSDEYSFDDDKFASQISIIFNKHNAPYWLDRSEKPFQFVPRGSVEQTEAVQKALETLRHDTPPAAKHLRQAAEHIRSRKYADAIRESIHAVESVARSISPDANNTLGPALNSLEKAGLLRHPALKEAFSKLYGYTNDEPGIRHSMIDNDTPDVGVDEAVFMFGACASFAAYLSNKHQTMNNPGGN